MARNEEKHAGRLNRLWLQQIDEEKQKKNPPRPGLGSLTTAAEVKKWIPSIKRDIDFYLKQSQVGCYPERQIADFSTKIESLTKEYRAYIRKLRELDPDRPAAEAWTDRAYSKKQRKRDTTDCGEVDAVRSKPGPHSPGKPFVPLTTPVLDQDHLHTELYGYEVQAPVVMENVNPAMADLPLEFNWRNQVEIVHGSKALEFNMDKQTLPNRQGTCDHQHYQIMRSTPDCLTIDSSTTSKKKMFCECNVEGHMSVGKVSHVDSAKCNPKQSDSEMPSECEGFIENRHCKTDLRIDGSDRKNPLGLAYSDSEEDEEEQEDVGVT